MKKKIILIGAGGHCKACIDVIEQGEHLRIAGLLDLPSRLGDEVMGYRVVGTDQDLPRLAQEGNTFLVTLGQITSSARREELFFKAVDLGNRLPVVISPLAYVSTHAEVGEGTIIMHGAIVNAGARIGRNCIVNTRALIEHGAAIDDHCHISTGAIVNGGARIERGCFIGSQGMVREGIRVGEHAIVGAGVMALHDVAPHLRLKHQG